MKLKRKLLAGLLTLCMAVGMAVPAFAENGPSSGDMSAAWVQLYDSSVEEPDGSYFGYVLYSNGGEADTVEGAVYDKATNTITLTNYNLTIISPNWLYGASAGAAIWKLPETAP